MDNYSVPLPSAFIKQRDYLIEKHRVLILEMRAIEKQIEECLSSGRQWNLLEDKRNVLYKQIEPLIERYWQWIPAVKLGQCPVCQGDFYHSFDPVDLNGFWWMDRTRRPVKEPKGCGHFRLLLGAIDFNGMKRQKTLFDCVIVSEKPFVEPRILGISTMRAVMSKIQMHCGFDAYPVCYFSEEEPAAGSLAQSWAQKQYYFTNTKGKSGWDIKEIEIDTDLVPWIKKGKLIWGTDSDFGVCPQVFP